MEMYWRFFTQNLLVSGNHRKALIASAIIIPLTLTMKKNAASTITFIIIPLSSDSTTPPAVFTTVTLPAMTDVEECWLLSQVRVNTTVLTGWDTVTYNWGVVYDVWGPKTYNTTLEIHDINSSITLSCTDKASLTDWNTTVDTFVHDGFKAVTTGTDFTLNKLANKSVRTSDTIVMSVPEGMLIVGSRGGSQKQKASSDITITGIKGAALPVAFTF